jgi:hypothetical protein
MFSRELNNANTVKRMADFLGHHLRIMKKVILILAAMLTFAACTTYTITAHLTKVL